MIILDRCIYEDYFVFAKSVHSLGFMNDNEWNIYKSKFFDYIKNIKAPDVIIYLKTSSDILLKRIQKRGRDYERSINLEYLNRLSSYYENFIEYSKNELGCEILVVETDNLGIKEI